MENRPRQRPEPARPAGDYAVVADPADNPNVGDGGKTPSGGGCGATCGNGLEKLYPTTVVRYGRMGLIGEFSHVDAMKFTCGAKVIIQTERGTELGEQVSLTCHGCEKSVSRDQMMQYVDRCGPEYLRLNAGRILREATSEDVAEWRHIRSGERDLRHRCRAIVESHRLPMDVVECEHIFGGERIIFYFMAEGRIDFRELVRDLAREFQTRIEMRQVGARDEARLLADYETCGRECCCKNFLKTLKPITMKMAKMQKATLDPSKVSGRCGRLKCCLRYEHESYEELDARLPRMGSWIRTSHGVGMVVDRQILTQLVQIAKDDGQRVTCVIEDVLETNLPKPKTPPPAADEREDNDGRRADRPRRRRGPLSERETDAPIIADGEADGDIEDDDVEIDETSAGADEPSLPTATTDERAGGRAGESAGDESGPPRRRRRRGRRGRSRRGRGPSDGDASPGPADGGSPGPES